MCNMYILRCITSKKRGGNGNGNGKQLELNACMLAPTPLDFDVPNRYRKKRGAERVISKKKIRLVHIINAFIKKNRYLP